MNVALLRSVPSADASAEAANSTTARVHISQWERTAARVPLNCGTFARPGECLREHDVYGRNRTKATSIRLSDADARNRRFKHPMVKRPQAVFFRIPTNN